MDKGHKISVGTDPRDRIPIHPQGWRRGWQQQTGLGGREQPPPLSWLCALQPWEDPEGGQGGD